MVLLTYVWAVSPVVFLEIFAILKEDNTYISFWYNFKSKHFRQWKDI